MFDEQLVTVWSAPNYCYRCGNMASIMTLHDDGSRSFAVYDAAPENARDQSQGRRLVSCRFFDDHDINIEMFFFFFFLKQSNMPYFV